MNKITVDLSNKIGKIKPLHCVNNGPSCNSRVPKDSSNFYLYKELGIPDARNHDASFFGRYGLEHTVDVVAIFPNFDADPYDPANTISPAPTIISLLPRRREHIISTVSVTASSTR